MSIPFGAGCGGGHGDAARPDLDPAALRRVFEAARLFIGHRERAAAMASGRLPPPHGLGAAIGRDFLAFDLDRAEQALRAAVIAADPDVAPVSLADPGRTPVRPAVGPEAHQRRGRGRRRSGAVG